jgi:glycosyltransferase involved in cell wall biosynthesis
MANSHSNTPRVSVVTATRNRPHLLREALLSIKKQSFQDYEALVVDDGSDPNVQEEYKKIWSELDNRFILHLSRAPGCPGSDPSTGRNNGIKLARGEFVAFLDHDDFWLLPDHLEIGVNSLSGQTADYFFTHIRGERNGPIHVEWTANPATLSNGKPILPNAKVYHVPLGKFLKVMKQAMVHPSHSILRRSLLEDVGGFFQGLKTADDLEIMFRLADRAKCILYRSEAAVAIRMPEGKSYSLASSQLEQTLSTYYAMLHARVCCRNGKVRRCIRAHEGWILRELAAYFRNQGDFNESLRFAWQSMTVWASPGAAAFFMRVLLNNTWR